MTPWRRSRARQLISFANVLFIAASLAGCGRGDANDDETLKVYVLIPSLSNDAYIGQRDGAEFAAAQLADDVEVTVDAPSTGIGDASQLIPKLEDAITKGADVIAVNAGAAQAELVPVLEGAMEDGIEVITFDVEIPELEGVSSHVSIDETNTSPAGGEYVKEQLPDGGELFVLSCVVGHPVTEARTDGFMAGLDGWPGEVVSTGDSQCDEAKARSIVENALTTYPELDAIYSTTAQATDGALKALEAAGKDLVYVSHDANAAHAELILDGDILDADIINPFQEIGATVVETAVKAGEGEGEDVDETILLPGGLVTKDTAADYLAELDSFT